jgi:GH15 family glucan-1,4-alpha-glucosidase
LYSTLALRQQSQDAISEFSLRAGEKVTFVFGGVRLQGQQPEMEFVEQRFQETARF